MIRNVLEKKKEAGATTGVEEEKRERERELRLLSKTTIESTHNRRIAGQHLATEKGTGKKKGKFHREECECGDNPRPARVKGKKDGLKDHPMTWP